MSADYSAVQKALASGANPAMLCATCPWDRNCVTPPAMTSAEIEEHIGKASREDQERAEAAKARGGEAPMPTATLLSALVYAGKDTSASVCPVFALRLKSSGGRRLADTIRAAMQGWDDQS